MLDLTKKQLSDALNLVIQEINRGFWLADRKGAAGGGIPVNLPDSVAVKARVVVLGGVVNVASITVSASGQQVSTAVESGTQSQTSNARTGQDGENINETTDTYGEV